MDNLLMKVKQLELLELQIGDKKQEIREKTKQIKALKAELYKLKTEEPVKMDATHSDAATKVEPPVKPARKARPKKVSFPEDIEKVISFD